MVGKRVDFRIRKETGVWEKTGRVEGGKESRKQEYRSKARTMGSIVTLDGVKRVGLGHATR